MPPSVSFRAAGFNAHSTHPCHRPLAGAPPPPHRPEARCHKACPARSSTCICSACARSASLANDHPILLSHALAEKHADFPVAADRARELEAYVMICVSTAAGQRPIDKQAQGKRGTSAALGLRIISKTKPQRGGTNAEHNERGSVPNVTFIDLHAMLVAQRAELLLE
jgi:hypothetical protein